MRIHCVTFVCRIERLEIFDEFEEWHMIQVSTSPHSTETVSLSADKCKRTCLCCVTCADGYEYPQRAI